MPNKIATKLVMIRKTDEFSSVFGFRKRFSGAFLIVHYRPNKTTSEVLSVRVGFVVAKKVAKLAVDRNYMRRVLRELCRQELSVLNHVDVVIQVKKPFKSSNFLSLKQELATLLDKIQHQVVLEKKTNE
ncbi:MAG: ribonuclease P protein component [Methylophilaceae bacterium]